MQDKTQPCMNVFFPEPSVSSFHTEMGMKKDFSFSDHEQNFYSLKDGQTGRQDIELTWKGLVGWPEVQKYSL